MNDVASWAITEPVENDVDCLLSDVIPDDIIRTCFTDARHKGNLKNLLHDLVTQRPTQNTESKRRIQLIVKLVVITAVHHCYVDADEYRVILAKLNQAKDFRSQYKYLLGNGTTNSSFKLLEDRVKSIIDGHDWRSRASSDVFINFTCQEDGTNQNIPGDVLAKIISYLDAKTVGRAIQVSKDWRDAEKLAEDSIWRPIFFRKWSDAVESIEPTKRRYLKRISQIHSLKIPLGRQKPISIAVFCPMCDKGYPQRHLLKKHSCTSKHRKISPGKEQSKKRARASLNF